MSQFRNLVFEGGGVKGIAYAGAIRVLEEKGILGDIRRVAGTSAGAITAALLAVGAKGEDIEKIVGQTSFRKFMDDSFGVLRDGRRLVRDYGWYKGDTFSDWMREQLKSFTGDAEVTFRTLRNGYRDLHVVGSDLSTQKEAVFSADLTPDMPVWQAVRISMSIPLFFAAVREQGRLFVDGGVSWNYPIDLFDDQSFKPAPNAVGPVRGSTYGLTHVYNKETLGFRVDTADEIKAELDHAGAPPKNINNFADYAAALVGFLLEMSSKVHLNENDWHRTVYIDAGGIRATDFDLSDGQVQALMDSGVKCATSYFEWFEDAKENPANRV